VIPTIADWMLFDPATTWALPWKIGAIAAIPWTAPGRASASASSIVSACDCWLAAWGPPRCWPGKDRQQVAADA
jgi:hypothetical protein